MTRSYISRVSAILVILFAAVHFVSAQGAKGSSEPVRKERPESAYRGGLITPPLPKPKATLTDTAGVPFDLISKTQGYVTLLYFGFTNCPDMCPLEMSSIARTLKSMPAEIVDQFKVIFVTTDPARDTPKALRGWLDRFDRRFIGLTGTDAAIEALEIAANVPPAKKSAARADGGYDVGHAAFVLAYTKDNLAHLLYPMGVTQADLEHDLRRLVTETWR